MLLDVTPLVLETAGWVTTKLIEQRNVHDFVLFVFPLEVGSIIVQRWEQIHQSRQSATQSFPRRNGKRFFASFRSSFAGRDHAATAVSQHVATFFVQRVSQHV